MEMIDSGHPSFFPMQTSQISWQLSIQQSAKPRRVSGLEFQQEIIVSMKNTV
jgi:hypothetical protein